jgi:phosphoglycolate phosphatase
MTRIDLVVFDVGGTTIRDTVDVQAVFAATLEHCGISPQPHQLRAWRGASKREVVERLVGAEGRVDLDPAAVYETFRRSVIEAFTTRGVQEIPGVGPAIRRLREHAVRVVLATGFDARVMAVILERVGWRDALDGVVTADDVQHGRPAPDLIFAAMRNAGIGSAEAVVAVGDTVNDLRAAAAAGAGARIGVLTGAHDRDELERAAPTAILASAAEVPRWLEDRRWPAA